MKRATSLVLVVLMLTSILASFNPIEMNEKETVNDADARADYEVWLIGANSPRESTVGIGGDVRNAVDVGEDIYFDLVIKNIGDNDISEMSITVEVTTGVPGAPSLVDQTDSAVCDDALACDHAVFPSGDYFDQGRYQVRDSSGNALIWNPPAPGTYSVVITVDSGDQDTDLNNNMLAFDVVATDWYDIDVGLVWDSTGEDGDMSGTDINPFTLTVMTNGSNEWQARNLEIEITFEGAFLYQDSNGNPVSSFDSGDGNGAMGCPGNPNQVACTFSVMVGEEVGFGIANATNGLDVPVFQNMSSSNNNATNASDIGETRMVPNFQQAYTYSGAIGGDVNAVGMAGYTVLASLKNYRIYEAVSTDYGSGPGGGNNTTGPGAGGNVVITMEEVNHTLDDRNGNNDAILTGYFAAYHDIRVIAVEAGLLRQQEGRMDAGVTAIYATVEHAGSSMTVNYDWSVMFSVKNSDGDDIMGSPMPANSCDLPGMENPYSHELLGEVVPAFPEGTACVEMLIDPGMHTITATVDFIDATTTDADPDNNCTDPGNDPCKFDMSSANDARTGHFELVNNGPVAYLTMESSDETLADGSLVQMTVRVEHLGQPDVDFDGNPEPFQYTWAMSGGEMQDPAMMNCEGMPFCDINLNFMWVGTPDVIVTVTDYWGVTSSASYSMTVWNNYSTTDSGDCWDVDYDIYFSQMIQYYANFTDADDVTDQTLDGSTGKWDSICTFDVDVTGQMYPADVHSETLSVTLDADPTVGHSLWREGATQWVELAGTTQSQVDADTITLSWSNDGTLPSRSSGTYAVFASATAGQPPQAGIDSLTATLSAAGVIELSWAVNNSALVSDSDFGVLYINDDGAALDGTRYVLTSLDQTTWTISGVHGSTYEFLVRVENGELDNEGSPLYGTPVDSGSAVADAQVDPTAGATALDAEKSGSDSISFVWSAADTSDVDHWMICWSPTAHTSLEVMSLMGAGNCHHTADSSTSATMARHTGAGTYLYSVTAMDNHGNMETQDSTDGLTFTEDADPGVDNTDTIGDASGSDDIPTQAWVAIGALVLVAVVAGAFILTRGGVEGDDDEFDY